MGNEALAWINFVVQRLAYAIVTGDSELPTVLTR